MKGERKAFLLRMPEDLQLLATMAAHDMGITLTAFITLAVREKVRSEYIGGVVNGKPESIGETVPETGKAGK